VAFALHLSIAYTTTASITGTTTVNSISIITHVQAKQYDPTAEHAKLWCPEVASLPPHALQDPSSRSRTTGLHGVVPNCDYSAPVCQLKFTAYKGHSSSGNNNINSSSGNSSSRGSGRNAKGSQRDKITQARRGARRNRVQNDYMQESDV
jgi:FAD binding domain of DNA photolyase